MKEWQSIVDNYYNDFEQQQLHYCSDCLAKNLPTFVEMETHFRTIDQNLDVLVSITPELLDDVFCMWSMEKMQICPECQTVRQNIQFADQEEKDEKAFVFRYKQRSQLDLQLFEVFFADRVKMIKKYQARFIEDFYEYMNALLSMEEISGDIFDCYEKMLSFYIFCLLKNKNS